jgi:hypothetical protein
VRVISRKPGRDHFTRIMPVTFLLRIRPRLRQKRVTYQRSKRHDNSNAPAIAGAGGSVMTLAEINRMIRAAIRAARKEGAPLVEVKIGDNATVRIPLTHDDKPLAEADEVVL